MNTNYVIIWLHNIVIMVTITIWIYITIIADRLYTVTVIIILCKTTTVNDNNNIITQIGMNTMPSLKNAIKKSVEMVTQKSSDHKHIELNDNEIDDDDDSTQSQWNEWIDQLLVWVICIYIIFFSLYLCEIIAIVSLFISTCLDGIEILF